MKRLCVIAPIVAAITLAACGSSGGNTSSPAGNSGAPAASSGASGTKVEIKNLAFSPPTIDARVGQTITWTNDDSPPHNVTYQGGPKFTSSGTLNPGQSFSLKLTSADVGTIHYYCTIHPFMKATIVVSQ